MIVDYDGQQHEFPDDFTDDDISSALASSAPPKRKVSPVEAFKRDLLIGGAGLGEKMAAVIGSPLLLLPDDNKLKEDYARGVVAPFAETKERLRAQEGDAERDTLATIGGAFGTMGSMAPELVAGGAAQSGVKLVDNALGPMAEALTRASVGAQPFAASGAADRYAEAKHRGMSTPEAVQAGTSKYLANTLMGMAPMGSVGPLFKRAATGVAAGPVVGSGTAAIENVIGPDEFNIDPYDPQAAIVNAVTGGVLHSALGQRGVAPKDLPRNQEVKPAAPIEYVQREIKDIQTRHDNVSLDISKKQNSVENISKSVTKLEDQITRLEPVIDSPKKAEALALLKEQLSDRQGSLNSITKQIDGLIPKQQMFADRLSKLTEAPKAEEVLQQMAPDATPGVSIEQRIARLEQVSERLNNPPPDFDAKEAAVVWKKTTEALTKETDEELRATLQIVQKQAEDMLANEELVTSKVNGNYIDTLDVDPSLQGHGFGAMKVKSLEADMLHQKHKEVTVLAKPESVGFWEKQGYTKSPQADISGNVLMSKKLGKTAEVIDQKQGHTNVAEAVIKTSKENGRVRPLESILAEAIQKAQNPWLKSFLTRLQNNPNLTRLKLARDDYTLIKDNAYAAYENSTGTVLARTDITPLAVAHEVMHGAANDVLIRYEAGEALPVTDRIAAKYMTDSWNKFKGRAEFAEWTHAMSNVREFVAHLTDERFANTLKAIDQGWFAKLYDKFVDLTKGVLNLSRSETQQFKDIMGTSNYLIDTSLGMATPKSILEAVGIIKKSDAIKSERGTVKSITELSEPQDPLALIQEKLQRDMAGGELPISTGEVTGRAPIAGRAELAQSLIDSPIVRHTNAVLKRSDELYEKSKRTILDGASAGKRKAFGILRNLTDTSGEHSYTTVYDKTNKMDLVDAAEVLVQSSRDQVAPDTLPGFARLSQEKQKLLTALREANKRAHDIMNEQLVAAGAKPIPFKEGYISHGREGDYAVNVHAKAANGEQVLAHHERFFSVQERDAWVAKVKQEHPELVIDPFKDVFSMKAKKANEKQINEQETLQMLAEANKIGGLVDPALLDQLRNMSLEGRFFGGHHMFQTSVEGYAGTKWFKTKQENARELFRAPFHYADEVSRFARNAYVHRNMDAIVDNPELMNEHTYLQTDPEILAAKELSSRVIDPNYDGFGIRNWINEVAAETVSAVHKIAGDKTGLTGYPTKSTWDRTNGALATVFNISKMMARPTFAVAQGLSWSAQVPQYLALQYKDSIGNQSKLMVAGMARAMDMRKGTDWDKFIERAKSESHMLKPLQMNDFTAIRKEFDNAKLNEIATKGTKILTGIRLSEMGDTLSRYMASAILWEKANQLGLTGEARYRFVLDGTDGAMGLFQKDTKAPLITKTDIFGDLVAPVSNYLIMQGNWLGTAVKRLAKNGELQPLMTVMLANIAAAGTIAAPLMLEYEILRMGINGLLDEENHLPSAVRKLHSLIGDTSGWIGENLGESAGRIADATLRQGMFTGAAQAGAEAFGQDRAPDIGAGLRYQALGKNLFEENKSIADSFSAWTAIGSDVLLIKDIISGKDNTEAGMRKGLAGLRTTIVHDFLTNHYLLPWIKANGKSMQTSGKDSGALMERTVMDDLAQALGGRSTRLVNESTAKQYRLEDDRKKQQAVSKAMQGILDLTVRQESGQMPPIMEGRMPMAVSRLQSLSKKYPDMEPFLNTIGQRLNEEGLKKALPDIVRVIDKAKPHEMKQKLEEYLKITGQEVEYE